MQVLTADPDHVDALHMLGMLHHQRGDHAEALVLLDRALMRAPGQAGILANRASVELARADYAAAEFDARVPQGPQTADRFVKWVTTEVLANR